MKKAFMGVRLKRLREERRLTQQTLADTLGISLSYLNQIENNQRPMTVPVLLRLNAAFGTDVQLFADNDEARLIGELRDVLSDPVVGESIALADIKELASNMPALARAFITQGQRLKQASEQISAYATRLGDDRQGRSAALPSIPFEEVRDFFYANHNYIDVLDRTAEAVAQELGMPLGRMADAIARRLEGRHGVRLAELRDDDRAGVQRSFDSQTRSLHLSRWLLPGQQAFQMATQIAFLEQRALIDGLAVQGSFTNDEARSLARIGLANYFAGALVLPYAPFLQRAEQLRYDIDLLSREFGMSYETICHRLSTLQRAEARGVPFFFIRVDNAGNISKRQSATDFHFSRVGGTCPLWNVYDAFSNPGKTLTQIAEMPDGRAYLWIARMVESSRGGFRAPAKRFAIGLGCDLLHAERLVYSLGTNPADRTARVLIGAGCRVCERARCPQRAFPPLAKTLLVDHQRSFFAPYSTT
ncbi:HTH-type transcriptional regulator PrpR [Hyphomicrobiales bacterium]|nr:HTH-type transcriptional regulator PrpR [Hyphomicrobiales bacterium]CAH1666596.1 HTH-type transcriptional regulator PrpR [Hyphomicrobiales bacterium]